MIGDGIYMMFRSDIMTEKDMKKRRLRLWLGVAGCVLMVIGELLWKVKGWSPIDTTLGSFADTAWLGIAAWRLVLSDILVAIAAPLCFIGYMEMYRIVREHARCKLEQRLAWWFRFGAVASTIAFVFIHTLCVSMPMIMQLIIPYMDQIAAAELVNQYMMLNIAPMIMYYLAADGVLFAVMLVIAWRRMLPVSRLALLCNPLCTAALGAILAMLPWPMSQIQGAAEPCGHLLIMVLGLITAAKDRRMTPHRRRKSDGDLPPVWNLDDEEDSDITVI